MQLWLRQAKGSSGGRPDVAPGLWSPQAHALLPRARERCPLSPFYQ